MVRRGIPVIVAAVGALWLGACSSDKASTSTDGSTVTSGSEAAAASSTTSSAPPTATAVETTAATTAGTSTESTTTATVAPRVVTSPSDSVKLGDSGKGVEQIQYALKANGYNVVIDGTFGPQTDTAVRAFQKKNGLLQDGIVGPITWGKLSAPSGGSSATSTTTGTPTATTAAASTTTTTG